MCVCRFVLSVWSEVALLPSVYVVSHGAATATTQSVKVCATIGNVPSYGVPAVNASSELPRRNPALF